ncbi:conjugal transfer protein TrbH [Anopheles sinensis]|uniref:Conjugal transfer protein TrbH n=1 Tax=Anopheles sinensis TaxID=74873 RepID=A0A084WHZ2_ANOSI|nr:conjugal transfer protein TrbH [Anopheles sinensis]
MKSPIRSHLGPSTGSPLMKPQPHAHSGQLRKHIRTRNNRTTTGEKNLRLSLTMTLMNSTSAT